MARSIYRIVQLEGLEKYKVQKFMLAGTKKNWWSRKAAEPYWITMSRPAYGYEDSVTIWTSLREAEKFIEELKRADAKKAAEEADNWIPVKGEL